ncbi:hypothetical protein WJX79_008472 [Trebouxia sp. C0005]
MLPAPRKLLQSSVQTLGGNVQTLEDEANADVADTLIDDALDVGSGRTNGADGTPGNPDGGAAPSGTNAGAVNPPPGSGRRLSQLQPGALQTTIGDAQTVEDQANADIADVAADDALDLISGRTNGADGPAPPGRRLHQLQPTGVQTTVGDVQTAEDQANADVADRVADDALDVVSGRSNGYDDTNSLGRKLLQSGEVQTLGGDVQTLEDEANADVADTLIDDALDVGSGRTNGADGTPGNPDGGAAPSGTNAGAVNPPPGSGRRLSQLQPGALQTTIGDAQTVEDEANADIADVAADDALDLVSGRTNGADGPAPPGRKLLQAGEVQILGGDVQTLEDEANADVADTLIDDALDVGSGRTNGADGTPGNPDGGAAPSGTNAGAVNPPPGSG